MKECFHEFPSFTPEEAKNQARTLRGLLRSALVVSREASSACVANLVDGSPARINYSRDGEKIDVCGEENGIIRASAKRVRQEPGDVIVVLSESVCLNVDEESESGTPAVFWSKSRIRGNPIGGKVSSIMATRADTPKAVDRVKRFFSRL